VTYGRLGLKVPTVLAAGELPGGGPQDESSKPRIAQTERSDPFSFGPDWTQAAFIFPNANRYPPVLASLVVSPDETRSVLNGIAGF
jgi:hypothetical protein